MLKKEFPILEFDEDKDAFINPNLIHKKIDISENVVLCFFGDAIDKLKKEYTYRIAYTLKFESYSYPIYEFDYNGNKISLVHMSVGAPVAAGMMDELNAIGCNKFIACGGCGVLVDNLPVGNLLIPTSAIRDEGTSYHYLKPAREIEANPYAVECIKKTLSKKNINFIEVKTWTTDAFFRETKAKIELRKSEGCISVEMEASAFMATAQFRNVIFGQILYAGDNLGGENWDKREWHTRTDIREAVLKLSLECCLSL